MKRKGNIIDLMVAETRVVRARTAVEREEAAADVVVTKFIRGLPLSESDAEALQRSLGTAEAMCRAARKAG